MKRQSRGERSAAILRKMEKIAAGRVNDAVKLAFLDRGELERIDGLDLSALTEFKRSGNGAVEVRLLDRVAALEKILELLGDREEEKTEAFFRALESGRRDGEA